MPKAALILLLALAALVTIANEAAADNGKTGACRFTGTVKLDGADVPDGTVIKALVGNDVYTTTTPTGYGPSTYTVEVRPPAGEGYAEGTPVRFTIDGYAANQTGSFQNGENIRWDLTATRPAERPAVPLTPTSDSSPGAPLVALIAVAFVVQLSAVGGVAYLAVTGWAR